MTNSLDIDDNRPEPVLDSTALDELRTLGQAIGQETLAKVVQAYFSEAPGLLRQLRIGLDRADAEVIKQAAHTLKSCSAYVGATHVRRLSEQLEKLAYSGEISDAGKLIAQLEEGYLGVAIALDKELGVAL